MHPLNYSVTKSLHHVNNRNGHECSYHATEKSAWKTPQLHPSLIKDIKKNWQHENKTHQLNYDVILRDNCRRPRKKHMPPTSTFVQKDISNMSTPQAEWTRTSDTFVEKAFWDIREVDRRNVIGYENMTQCSLLQIYPTFQSNKIAPYSVLNMSAASFSEMSVDF
jgi:hypothetical protein